MLTAAFFEARDTCQLARDLLGKVLRRRVRQTWLSASIVETEAYLLDEPASHSSLGRTPSREAMWMPPGTVYMYYSRGGDSLNVSARGPGNAVLIKAAVPFTDARSGPEALELMHSLNPVKGSGARRALHRLCSGQTLLCRALDLEVREWNGRAFDAERFLIEDVGYAPTEIIETRRLGIPAERDRDLLYRFIDRSRAGSCTKDPTRVRAFVEGVDYRLVPAA